jgi:hypothetical protein
MPDRAEQREAVARTLANVAWSALSDFHKESYLRKADVAIAAYEESLGPCVPVVEVVDFLVAQRARVAAAKVKAEFSPKEGSDA